MTLRWGLGPVFAYDWLTTSRRWQYYAGRSLFVTFLLAALLLVWFQEAHQNTHLTRRQLAAMGEKLFYGIIGTQLALVLLVAPAMTAGAICVDKVRGTLLHLLVTDLSNAEIILGKLATRLVNLFGLVACGLPVLFLGMLMGGIDPEALTAAFFVSVGVALLGGTLGLTLSVWCRKTYEVLLASYTGWIIYLLLEPTWRILMPVPVPSFLPSLDPFWLAFAPYRAPGATTLIDAVEFLGLMAGLSVLLALLAIWRVRAVAVRQSHLPSRRRRRWPRFLEWMRVSRWLPGPALDFNPVLWREWRHKRPSRWVQGVWLVYGLACTGFSAYVIARYLGNRFGFELGPFVNAFQVSIGLLLASVAAVTALSEERERGGLPILLATPLSTLSILLGKWWGVYRTIFWLTILPGMILATRIWMVLLPGQQFPNPVPAWSLWLGAVFLMGVILAYGAAFTSLGLALATWVARQARAIALQVVSFVLIAVGFVLVAMLLLDRNDWSRGLACGSPWFGPGMMTAVTEAGFREWGDLLAWIGSWIIIYVTVAIVLFGSTLATFDRCLGRVAQNWKLTSHADRP
jgi:ABC-type transport system involved in multi-copper enzyme maturation permease subunit